MRRFLLVFITIFTLFIPQSAFASSNDFYFKDATFDYYLENSDSGTTMHVKEVLTAVFPDTNQNHGITRAIPFSNLDGKNITIENPNALNLKVTRNGAAENISKIDKDEDEYIIYIGSGDDYVHGEQVYTLEYDFHNVITEFASDGANLTGEHSTNVAYQELYWDTNGTGWTQKFDHLTANLHLDTTQSKALIGNDTACFVGKQGSSNRSRCDVTFDDETTYSASSLNSSNAIPTAANTSETIISFETSDLSPRENLTFAVAFQPGTFTVPDLPLNYSYVIITIITLLVCLLIIGLFVLFYFKKAKANRNYYKALFETPQYAPQKGLSVAEAANLTLKKTKNPYVATLLELAVSGKITIIKGEPTKAFKKDTWNIQINSIADLTDCQEDLLKLLAGGKELDKLENDIIKIEKHAPTASLAALSKSFNVDAQKSLEEQGFFRTTSGAAKKKSDASAVVIALVTIGLSFLSFKFIPVIIRTFVSSSGIDLNYGVVIGKEYLPFVIGGIIVLAIIICAILGSVTARYKKYTEKGLDAAGYLDGLYLYIKMAEADRIKFLQSTKGADTSPKGIVKLYEKLLPYACLFGLEESWLGELGKYCKEINYSPSWYGGNDFITFYALSSMTRSINSTVQASSAYGSGYSRSGSGGSSFGSGISGGFSGGGGGGGGGGGW